MFLHMMPQVILVSRHGFHIATMLSGFQDVFKVRYKKMQQLVVLTKHCKHVLRS